MICQGYYEESNSASLTLFVYLIWVVISAVLLMNLLIGMMGKTFQREDEDVDRIWTFPFAALVLKYERLNRQRQVLCLSREAKSSTLYMWLCFNPN